LEEGEKKKGKGKRGGHLGLRRGKNLNHLDLRKKGPLKRSLADADLDLSWKLAREDKGGQKKRGGSQFGTGRSVTGGIEKNNRSTGGRTSFFREFTERPTNSQKLPNRKKRGPGNGLGGGEGGLG